MHFRDIIRPLTPLCATLIGLACPHPAMAQTGSAIALGSAVYVERVEDDSRVLVPASRFTRGDRVVAVVTWRRAGPGGRFTVTNPLPRGLYYQGSASDDGEVSVDGGRTWGKLGDLRLGDRLATPEDVTHLRWRVASAAAAGRIAYSAIVR